SANRAQEEAVAGQSDIFGGSGEPEPLRVQSHEPWTGAERLQREYDAIGFFLSGHPLDDYEHVLQRLRVQRWTDFARAVKAGASMGRVAATVLDRQERRTKSGSKMGILALSDQSGHFEAIVFQEGLNQLRDVLEPGKAVVLTVQASAEGEEVRARIVAAEPLDKAASKLPSSLRIFLRDDRPLPSITERLKEKGDGEVTLVLMVDGGQREVEVKLAGRFKATPQVAGAIKAVPGVVAVEYA
ncbi:MAG: DNA polymerase III subunit alpha, partial [Alsobacter sp.]